MSQDTINKFLPNCLKALREEAQLPQRKVAAAIDLDTATYSKIENGKYIPNKSQVETLADFYKKTDRSLSSFGWQINFLR